MPPLHKPVRGPGTFNWVFSGVTGAFYWHSPHSSSSRVGWINASQSSSSIRYSQASPEYSTQGAWGKLSIEGSIFMMSENFSLVYPMPLGFFSNMFTLCLCLGVHFQSPHTWGADEEARSVTTNRRQTRISFGFSLQRQSPLSFTGLGTGSLHCISSYWSIPQKGLKSCLLTIHKFNCVSAP